MRSFISWRCSAIVSKISFGKSRSGRAGLLLRRSVGNRNFQELDLSLLAKGTRGREPSCETILEGFSW